jgi:hypothetical protein
MTCKVNWKEELGEDEVRFPQKLSIGSANMTCKMSMKEVRRR